MPASIDSLTDDLTAFESDPKTAAAWSALKDRCYEIGIARGRRLGVVLGSGLGGLADAIESPTSIAYGDIPGLSASTAAGHRGEFLFGELEGQPILAMAGRLHVYEGHDLIDVTRPIALMAAMGVDRLVVSCAAGGLNPNYRVGDLAVIREHSSWLAGRLGAMPMTAAVTTPSVDQLHRRMTTCDETLRAIACQVARRGDFELHDGMYLAVTGPNYETRAECRMMRTMGVDLVGMSTVPEILAASSLGVRTLGIAVVTNLALPDAPATADHADVLEVCGRASERLQRVVRAIATNGMRCDV